MVLSSVLSVFPPEMPSLDPSPKESYQKGHSLFLPFLGLSSLWPRDWQPEKLVQKWCDFPLSSETVPSVLISSLSCESPSQVRIPWVSGPSQVGGGLVGGSKASQLHVGVKMPRPCPFLPSWWRDPAHRRVCSGQQRISDSPCGTFSIDSCEAPQGQP